MAVDVKTIICPQCGSTDVGMTSETKGTCNACGSIFTVQQRIEQQNVYNEFNVYEKGEMTPNGSMCSKGEIVPEYTKEEFLREAWKCLADEDIPIEVFEEDFTITQEEHDVFINSVEAEISYTASIGFDREEPYIDYEDYYENEQYMETVTKYDSRGSYNEVVPKTRRVKKQRQVTKYRTVTDWSSQSGKHYTNSIAFVENTPGDTINRTKFTNSFVSMKADSLLDMGDETKDTFQISDEAYQSAFLTHEVKGELSVELSLPGDRHKDVKCHIDKLTDKTNILVRAPEFLGEITFGGTTYTKRAFPFGDMSVEGDRIPNADLDGKVKELRDRLNERIKERNSSTAAKTKIIKRVGWISGIGVFVLGISLMLAGWESFLFRLACVTLPIAVVIGAFAIAGKESDKTEMENETDTRIVNAEIDDYSNQYKKILYRRLNEKLESLGLEKVLSDYDTEKIMEDTEEKFEDYEKQVAVMQEGEAPVGGTEKVMVENEPVYCGQCGAKIISGAKFCNQCGKSIKRI